MEELFAKQEEIIRTQSEVVRIQSEAIDELFRVISMHLAAEELGSLRTFDKLRRAARLREALERNEA